MSPVIHRRYGTSLSMVFLLSFLLLLSGLLLPVREASAQSTGAYPRAALIQGRDGNLYGVTSGLGLYGSGTVFKITRQGVLTTLYNFSALNYVAGDYYDPATNADGASPQAALTVGRDGNFYGVTYAGGIYGYGTVFKITPVGVLTTLYDFSGDDGVYPQSALALGNDGNLYGTTTNGGINDNGTLFAITPAGVFTTLHTFNAFLDGSDSNADGSYPTALVPGKDGSLYGTTSEGGAYGYGTIFRITPAGTLTTLHSFYSSDGAYPSALILAPDGNFYGTTNKGGPHYKGTGTVFRVTSSGTVTTLHTFTVTNKYNVDGAHPQTALALGSNGNLYGTATQGGKNGTGTTFSITSTGAFTTLIPNSITGFNLCLASDGNFYGTSQNDGLYNRGTVFQLTNAGVRTTLYNLGVSNGADPVAGVLISNGNCYGVTSSGGKNGTGSIFRITPAGTLYTLYSFTALSSGVPATNTDGAGPRAGLTLGKDGYFYGVTFTGGANGNGTIYRLSPNGSLTLLHAFSSFTGGTYSNADGANPQGAMILGKDNNFYGTTYQGGQYSRGTIFKITPSGTMTTLYNFGSTAGDGGFLRASLLLGSDGNFYGVTPNGGSGRGTIFKVTPSGSLTLLYSFGTTTGDGSYPYAALTLGKDGNFYGSTYQGGQYGYGTLFAMTPTGTLTTLYSFSSLHNGTNTDGANPQGALALGSNGNLYGAASAGGADGYGTLFTITPTGTFTLLYSFSALINGYFNDDGITPYAALTSGANGDFYGAASGGGFNGGGTVFEVTPAGTLTALFHFSN